MGKPFIPSRRDVLKSGGALVVSFSFAGAASHAAAENAAAGKPLALTAVDSFLAIDSAGAVTIYSGKVDLGTGVQTALTQIAAEELDVPLRRVAIVQGDTALTPDQGPTFGSLAIQVGGVQIRNACAMAKGALLDLAAKQFGTSAAELKVADGVIRSGDKQASYGELIGGKSFSLTLDHQKPPATKDPKTFTIVGTSIPRIDIPDKVTGKFTYMQDMRVPGMLHGRVVRPPALGAQLQSVDEASVAGIPGILRVVREGNFLGIVAENEWAAIKAAQQIKATWSAWEGLPEQRKLFEHVRASKVAKDEVTANVGNTAEAMAKDGVKKLSATYEFAIHTHGSIGPSCAIAEFKDGIYIEGSGCYGRNGHEDAAADAALLAKAVGRPVRVQWSRADEHGWDPKGPPTLIDLRATLDSAGAVTAWDSEFFIPQQTPNAFVVPLVAATLSGKPADETIAPGNVFQNSNVPYKFANIKAVCHRLETTPFRPSWIRTPGRLQNTFANECFMDELAAAADADPIEFRLKYLDPADTRGVEILNRVAALAQWDKRPSPRGGSGQSGDVVTGRGVSYCKYELVRTYIAVVAEVEVKRSTGEIRARKFFVLHDCGQIINPDGVLSQIEGNIIQTVSRTLKEELAFSRSAVTSLDWASYPILTFPEVPDMVIDLIDRPAEKPWGAGEPSAAVVPSAISNAVFDATGVRLRSVPFTPEKVKEALRRGA
jgi:nicotinate dehydrogenase subunit B